MAVWWIPAADGCDYLGMIFAGIHSDEETLLRVNLLWIIIAVTELRVNCHSSWKVIDSLDLNCSIFQAWKVLEVLVVEKLLNLP